MTTKTILFVDDDEKVLNGIERQFEDEFEIQTALGPHDALEMFEKGDQFAVVVSDMRMPEMTGVELLKRIRNIAPDTVRMMLTGFAELSTTIEAVNEGHIFLFLSKPCREDLMANSLRDALRQFALVEAERELVEGTLRGSIDLLSDVLSLLCPAAFGQSTRVKSTVDGVLRRVDLDNKWQIEIAAMLSSLGCITLPEESLQKRLDGRPLSPDECETLNGHPIIARDLLRNIPRLDQIAEIIAHQNCDPDSETPIPYESRLLKLALDYDVVERNSESSFHALNKLKERKGDYEEKLFDALEEFVKEERNVSVLEIELYDVVEGMVLAEDVRDDAGRLLMSKGQEISSSAQRLLENISRNRKVSGPIRVIPPQAKELAPA